MDVYYAPGSSSQATYTMLHEAALSFRPLKVDIISHSLEDGSDFTQINPYEYVPALVFGDGTLLTKSVAILDWLAGRTRALPSDEGARILHLQILAFLSSEVHKPFIPLFFTNDQQELATLRLTMEARLLWIGGRVKGPYLGCDALHFAALGQDSGPGLSPVLDAFVESVEQRSSLHRSLADEGLESLRARLETRLSPATSICLFWFGYIPVWDTVRR